MKKIISFLTAVLLVVSMAGCQNTASNQKQGDGAVPKLTWYTFGSKQADHDIVMEAVNKILKEKIGAELEMNLIDMGSYESKMNLSISANESFDICFTSN